MFKEASLVKIVLLTFAVSQSAFAYEGPRDALKAIFKAAKKGNVQKAQALLSGEAATRWATEEGITALAEKLSGLRDLKFKKTKLVLPGVDVAYELEVTSKSEGVRYLAFRATAICSMLELESDGGGCGALPNFNNDLNDALLNCMEGNSGSRTYIVEDCKISQLE